MYFHFGMDSLFAMQSGRQYVSDYVCVDSEKVYTGVFLLHHYISTDCKDLSKTVGNGF